MEDLVGSIVTTPLLKRGTTRDAATLYVKALSRMAELKTFVFPAHDLVVSFDAIPCANRSTAVETSIPNVYTSVCGWALEQETIRNLYNLKLLALSKIALLQTQSVI